MLKNSLKGLILNITLPSPSVRLINVYGNATRVRSSIYHISNKNHAKMAIIIKPFRLIQRLIEGITLSQIVYTELIDVACLVTQVSM